MFRTVCSVCYLFLAASIYTPAFAKDVPKPSDVEIKAMSEKLTGKVYLFIQVWKENDQNTRDIDEFLSKIDNLNTEERMRRFTHLLIRSEETRLKLFSFIGIESKIIKQRTELGDLYGKVGNIEKACEHWKEGRNLALKLELAATAEDIGSKLATTCQNKTP